MPVSCSAQFFFQSSNPKQKPLIRKLKVVKQVDFKSLVMSNKNYNQVHQTPNINRFEKPFISFLSCSYRGRGGNYRGGPRGRGSSRDGGYQSHFSRGYDRGHPQGPPVQAPQHDQYGHPLGPGPGPNEYHHHDPSHHHGVPAGVGPGSMHGVPPTGHYAPPPQQAMPQNTAVPGRYCVPFVFYLSSTITVLFAFAHSCWCALMTLSYLSGKFLLSHVMTSSMNGLNFNKRLYLMKATIRCSVVGVR